MVARGELNGSEKDNATLNANYKREIKKFTEILFLQGEDENAETPNRVCCDGGFDRLCSY